MHFFVGPDHEGNDLLTLCVFACLVLDNQDVKGDLITAFDNRGVVECFTLHVFL